MFAGLRKKKYLCTQLFILNILIMTLAKAIPALFGHENPAHKVVMCLSALVLLTFSSCINKDDNPATPSEPADMVRLVSIQSETAMGMFSATTETSNVWENGRLIRQASNATTMGITTKTDEILTYNKRGLCTEMYDTDGHYHHYYTYTPDGRIAKEVHIIDGNTSSVTEVIAYDADGNVAETIPRWLPLQRLHAHRSANEPHHPGCQHLYCQHRLSVNASVMKHQGQKIAAVKAPTPTTTCRATASTASPRGAGSISIMVIKSS